jgi:hypothetical protein
MHGKKFLVSQVLFGSDGESLFVRVDFRPGSESELGGMEARMTLQSLNNAPPQPVTIRLAAGAASSDDGVECAFQRILEARLPLAAAGVPEGGGVRFQLSLWHGGLPVDAVPQQGWLEMPTTCPMAMAD